MTRASRPNANVALYFDPSASEDNTLCSATISITSKDDDEAAPSDKPASAPKAAEVNDKTASLRERLEQLKAAYDSGLLTKAEYDAKRKEIIDSFK